MAYSGKFSPNNIGKYEGNVSNIVFRSLWELQVMKWCDSNPSVKIWSSEEFFIPYICKTDQRPHRYFVDFKIVFTSGSTILVEVKPEHQVKKPIVAGKKVTKQLVESIATYTKNVSKWEAAEKYCGDRGWSFHIWDQNSLAKLGIKIGQQPSRSKR